MAGWRLRQSYGSGAARLALAPVFTPGPWTAPERSTDALARLVDEIAAQGARPYVRAAAGAAVLALAVACAVLVFTPAERERDQALPEIVLLGPAEPQRPEPEPLVEAEPEPPPLAEAPPEPAPEAVAPVERPKPPAPAPLRAEPPPAPRPRPQLRIDAVARAPAPAPVTPERVERTETPKRPAPAFRIDPVAPSFAVAATAAPAGQPAPLRAVARSPARAAPPVAFPLEPVAAAEPAAPPFAMPRTEPRTAPVRVASAKPAALPRFDAAPPPARYAEAPAPPPLPPLQRVAPVAAQKSAAAAPEKAFQGVPLGSLAACVSDREEDALKLQVMARAGLRHDCSSRAGRYRFVETKNLNAFLMWIERSTSRKAEERCVELRLALECLAVTPNRRTDNG